MNNRVKELRKTLKLSGEAFGERIGIKKSALSLIENGKNNVTEQTFKSICREFNVNEEWLRTGEGEMFNTFSKDEQYAVNVGKLQRTDDETIMRWVNAIAETDPESLKAVEAFLKKILDIKN